jgi:hypothetical protein
MRFNLVIILILTAAVLLASSAGSTIALFSDSDISNIKYVDWISALWTQNSQADFNAGVLDNVETSSSPGDAKLPLSVTTFSPSANAGNWTNGANGYSANNQYATFTPPNTVSPRSPTTNTGSAWTTPANAYASDTSYATITSGTSPGNNIWGAYGFSLSGGVVTQVRVRYDAFSTGSNISFQAAGANAVANGDSITPGLPAGWAANDIWLCLIASSDTVNSTMPAGWTAIDAGTDNGKNCRTTLYYRRAVAGDVAPVVTHIAGGHITASIAGYHGCITSGSPFDVNQAVYVKTAASSTNDFGAGMTTTTNNDMIVLLSATNDDTTSDTYTGVPVPVERIDAPYAHKWGDLIVADFILAVAGATGSRTSTILNRVNNGYQLSLKPDMPQIRIDVSWDGGATWSAQQVTTLNQSKTSYWYDVTSATAWDSTKLNDNNFKVRASATAVGSAAAVSLDWLPVEVSAYDPALWSHTYSNYGVNLTGALISTVEAGFEAFATGSGRVQMDVTWNNGANWSARQTSGALGSSDPNTATWFDFTPATSWTPATLSNANFEARIWYLNNGAFGMASLDYLPVTVTYRISPGTIASQVFDTAVTASRWDALFWDENLPANTDITFAVRASDTAFLKADVLPSWTAVGGTSPVSSGLPPGRYKQWRATLTTTVSSNTPTLSEVRVYYSQ